MALDLADFSIYCPEFVKYIWDSATPYSDALNIPKERRSPEHTKRPLNAFMLFAKLQRDQITTRINCNHSEISKALGRLWRSLNDHQKEPFVRGARMLVDLHRREYPEYKYRPRKKGEAKETAKTPAATKKPTTPRRERQRSRKVPVCDPLPLDHSSPGVPVTSPGLEELMVSPASSFGRYTPTTGCVPDPCSPISTGSSSGYESGPASGEVCPSFDELVGSMSPEPLDNFPQAPDDLDNIQITALDESTFFSPLNSCFPTSLSLGDVDFADLSFHL